MIGLHGAARALLAVGLAVVLGAAAFLVLPRFLDDPGLPRSGPDEWAPEVLPLVEVVERERDLEFRHPVHVDFLAPEEFEAQLAADEDELTDEDRDDIADTAAFFRALGLVGDDVDVFDESQKLQQAGVGGYYSFEDERIRVRGSELTLGNRAILVHELTHALQDQRLAIGDTIERLQEEDDTTRAGAFRALVEGDASRVETAYREGLPKKQRAELARLSRKEAAEFGRRSRDIPQVMVALLSAPYVLCGQLLELAAAVEGDDAVDDLFTSPPTTEEHLLDPWTLLVDPDAGRVVDVGTPRLGQGEKKLDSGDFGALGWYVVLSQRLEERAVLDAVDGWGGDAYTTFERDGRSCVRVAYRGDTRRDVRELASALDTWIDRGSGASLERPGGGLLFTSCATQGRAGTGRDTGFDLPLVRTAVTAQVVEGGAPQDFARCYAARIIDTFTPEQVASNDPDVVARARALGDQCL